MAIRSILLVLICLASLPAAAQDPPPPGATWEYEVFNPGGTGAPPTYITCIRSRFPANVATNSAGWAPSEGAFYHEDPQNPGFILPPVGLARAMLECYVTPWDSQAGALYHDYCWDDPTPWYIGTYPNQRQAHFRIYHALNSICDGPPQGTSIYEATLNLVRRAYYPPPMFRNGLE